MNFVFVEDGDVLTEEMFDAHNEYCVVDNPDDATMIVFTGGADVSPAMYGAENTDSYCNAARDLECVGLYLQYPHVKRVGICPCHPTM